MKLLPILKVNVLRHVFYLLMPLKHLIEFVILICSMFVKAQHVCSYKKIAYDVIANYSMLDSFSRCKVHTSFCMSLYGSELWNYKSRYGEEIVVAWRKTMRMLFRLPYRTHNYIVCGITEDISIKLHRRVTKFMYSMIHSDNDTVKLITAFFLSTEAFF